MEFLVDFWMPIVVSAVILFIASSLIHMALPIHKGEWKALPDEDRLLDAVRGVPSGHYMFPFCEVKDMKSPQVMEKIKNSPNGTIVIFGRPTQFARNLMLTFIFFLVVGVFVAYVGAHSLSPEDTYLAKFRIIGTVATASHVLGWIPNLIWFGGSSRMFWSYLFDGVVYGLLTAGTFGWLWPQ